MKFDQFDGILIDLVFDKQDVLEEFLQIIFLIDQYVHQVIVLSVEYYRIN